MTLIRADCLEAMAQMPAASVDAIVTDPPYGLEFMGKEWDRLWNDSPDGQSGRIDGRGGMATFGPRPQYIAGSAAQEWHQRWATEALRVAKPGAYLLAFGGTRTYHRLACAIEDAGWIIRDCLVWAYASGFPKSRALLKPAWEPIVMARKPGPLRELAIDACRIATDGETFSVPQSDPANRTGIVGLALQATGNAERNQTAQRESIERTLTLGRWPANVVLTDPIFDGGIAGVVGGGESATHAGTYTQPSTGNWFGGERDAGFTVSNGDSGTYSRFFLIPKADRAEREPVFGGLAETPTLVYSEKAQGPLPQQTPSRPSLRRNHHPTVKPLDLMRHLVRLVTPSGGVVLDPFAGSGTTLIAAEMEGFAWIGVEREADYVAIIEARLQGVQRGLGLDVPAPTPMYTTPSDAKMPPVRFNGKHQNTFGIPYDRREDGT